MIAIIDYDAGNLTSVQRAIRSLGFDSEVTRDHHRILAAERVIFPGVGAAGSAMSSLKKFGLERVLKEVQSRGTPLLGICLGEQVIFEYSEENEGTDCLGLLPGRVKKFPADINEAGRPLKVPHMGWNQVNVLKKHPFLKGWQPEQEFYFVHSYYPVPADNDVVLGSTDYGLNFASIVGRDNLLAVQFHPEKSGRPGLNLLRNFCEWNGHA
ncbi:MAG: imidazole glycerol phosphate synthase subunit HisH [Deltaproteobacteria bacterium]|nr:imidazole glycerol phosphate synthase subunit HisH [Deltaproteobacteria bacterium]